MTSRAIFQRMRSYALYRITSTVHFLMFFFIVVMAYDWSLPARLLILICILNDLATLVIAVDNAQLSPHPDKWRIGQLITMSVVLGICLTALSFAHFFTFWKHFHYEPLPESANYDDRKLESVMYLHISSAPHFVIFSTRLTGYFWENLPSPLFAAVIIGTQIIALLMVVFGGLTPKVPFSQAIVVLLISFAYFIILDVVKVQLFKVWSFELTAAIVRTPARRKKLAERKAHKIQQERVWNSIDHIREIILKLKALEALNEAPTNEGETMEDPRVYEQKEKERQQKKPIGKEEIEALDAANAVQGAPGGSTATTAAAAAGSPVLSHGAAPSQGGGGGGGAVIPVPPQPATPGEKSRIEQ
ncbi:hypothetical protein BGZ54_007591 [Gamsiella multidivaricata]|nr:hypothetical protein BGZ54_007591 [Gamsiella multidivaricata]